MNESDMQHGLEWRGQNIKGWLASEKLNGCRGYWDGYEMWSRGGLPIHLPHRIRAGLPTGFSLDGEIFASREADGLLLATEAVVYDRWDIRCRFKVFDAPLIDGGWSERIAKARTAVGIHAYVSCVPIVKLSTASHAMKLLARVKEMKGEGIMVRHPTAPYRAGRHSTVLKIKRDASWLPRPSSYAEKIAA